MDILILLQVITISISVASLSLGYIVNIIAKKRDNKTQVFTKKLLSNIHFLRLNIEDILAAANPSTIREAKHMNEMFDTYKKLYINDVFNEAISNIKSIFFPFYPQENNFLISLEELKTAALNYYSNTESAEFEKKLKKEIAQLYVEYCIYDKAMCDSIEIQTTKSNYKNYTFDEFYKQLMEQQNLDIIRFDIDSYSRQGQEQQVKAEEVENLIKAQEENLKENKIHYKK